MLLLVLRPARPSTWVLVAAAVLAAFIMYVLAFDQGQLLSLVQGDAYAKNFIHELVHDARHAAGFPCH